MSISEQKASLREALLQKRLNVSSKKWKENSAEIVQNLKAFAPFYEAKCVHSFISINERKEVNTHPLLQELLEEGTKVIIPITDFSTGELYHTELTSFDNLKPNKWGVLELPSPTITSLIPDVILVPLLAADLLLNRIGYGKGFYDRFLATTKAIKIGLVFHEFIINEIPVEHFDQKLDILISEKEIISRNN